MQRYTLFKINVIVLDRDETEEILKLNSFTIE